MLLGFAAGLLVAGLGVPMLFGERLTPTDRATAQGPLTGEAGDPASLEGTEAGAGPGTTAAGGSAAGATASTSTAGSGPAGAAAAARKGGRTDPGVFADRIRLGIPIPNISAEQAEAAGVEGFDAAAFERQFQAFIDDANARGGVNGRKLDPVFRRHDISDADDQRAACNYLTEDAKVFAILNLGSLYGDAVLCITEQHGTLDLDLDGATDDWYIRSKGLLFSMRAGKSKIFRNLVAELERMGKLKGRTIGIVDADFPSDREAVDRALLPALKQRGYTVAHHTRLSNDAAIAQSQIPVEVSQMRSKGVDAVFVGTNFLYMSLFAQEGEAQQWSPTYLVSDIASSATDLSASFMPDTYKAYGYTSLRTGEHRIGLPEPAFDAACRKTYEEQTGEQIERGTDAYSSTLIACSLVRTFELAATRTGPNLTRAAFSATMQALGKVTIAYTAPSSFGRGKFDAPDQIRSVEWRRDCRCIIPLDAFRDPPTR